MPGPDAHAEAVGEARTPADSNPHTATGRRCASVRGKQYNTVTTRDHRETPDAVGVPAPDAHPEAVGEAQTPADSNHQTAGGCPICLFGISNTIILQRATTGRLSQRRRAPSPAHTRRSGAESPGTLTPRRGRVDAFLPSTVSNTIVYYARPPGEGRTSTRPPPTRS